MVSIEDPFDQDDWDGYRPFTAAVGEKARDTVTPSSPTRHPPRHPVVAWSVGADRWG